MKKFLFILATVFLLAGSIQAQSNQKNDTASYPYWIEMMQDQDANFYDVQSAFNTYWEGKTPGKSSGWKQFKRWEYSMQFKIDDKGFRLPTDQMYKEVMRFQSQRSSKSDADWINLGPIDLPENTNGQPNGMGRISAIAFHPTNEDIIYIGAPQGGLWKSIDGGGSWEVYTDNQATLGVSSIIIDTQNPSIILIGTGDVDAGNADGMGVFKSLDGGDSWQMSNNGMGNLSVGRMIQDPVNTNTIIAATNGGVYKSTDLGDNWTLSQNGNFKDILFKPNNPDIVYTITSSNFYKSTDNGDSFSNSSSGLPSGSRGAIAVSPDDPERVYALLADGSVFSSLNESTDAGDSWSVKSTTPNIFDYSCYGNETNGVGWYAMDIAADPNNADFLYVGSVNTWVSANAGSNWEIKSHWYGGCDIEPVHADMHVYEINPLNNRLYNGNDGGLYYSDYHGDNWVEVSSGLAISQIYQFGSSATVKDLVINGYQDNGTATLTPDGWITVRGGDGMDCIIDWADPSYSYSSIYYGAIDRVYNNSITQGSIVNGISEDGDWVTPYTLSHIDANTMFIGMKNVWRTNNVKASNTNQISWTQISDFNGGNCNILTQSDANADILFVGKGSTLILCENANAVNPVFTTISGLPGSGDVRSIATDPNNENRIFMAKGNGIYYSEDLCDNWIDITGNLPSIPMRSIVYYKNSIDGLYVGAQAGIYYKDSSLDDWVLYNQGFPLSSQVTELEIFYDSETPSGDRLRASTYGRGLWESIMYQGILASDFVADQTEIPSGCAIQFTDLTTGVPQSWAWTFEGGTPSSSTEHHPIVIYENNGSFSVSLEVTNNNGSDNISKDSYILVNPELMPDVHFSADKQFFCPDEEMIVYFSDESIHCPISWQWSFSPNTINYLEDTDAQSQNPIVEFTQDGSYAVSLEVTNSNGSSSLTEYEFIKNGGKVGPYHEEFEDEDDLTNGWSIENEDGGITWEKYNASGNGGEKAMAIHFRDYSNFGARDRLISPLISLYENTDATLSFEHAYAQHYSSYTDSLIVYISTDCGENWTRLMEAGEDGNGSFATHELITDDFVPEVEDDWCLSGFGPNCYQLDLSDYKGEEYVSFAFESYNMRGTYLYIDNVSIDYAEATNELGKDNKTISIFPNPNNGQFDLELNINMKNARLEIFDPIGRLVYKNNDLDFYKKTTQHIVVDNYTSGVYYIRISNNEAVIQTKFVME